MDLIEELSSRATLRSAWEKVEKKRGAAGIDRVTVEDFGADLENNLQRLHDETASGAYRSLPVTRIRPSFLAATERPLVVLTVRDRVVHRAIADLLSPKIDPTFSPGCRAFRKGRSALGAAEDVGRWVDQGTPWLLRADVRGFFDAIRPDLLLGMLEPFVDASGLRFLERILRSRVFDRHQVSEMIVGIPQGSPLSPLLANLYLSDVDATFHEEFPRYIRYCDDSIVLGREEQQAREAHRRMIDLIAPLGLELNEEKTRICRAEDGFIFLGYHFGAAGRGPAVKAVEALRCRLHEIAAGPHPDPRELDAVYRGWVGYFGDHPECWTGSPAGILALLRARQRQGSETPCRSLCGARWKLSPSVPPEIALELARAWSAAGCEEQSWLELASACGGSKADPTQLERWAQVLATDSSTLDRIARKLVGPSAERLRILKEALAELGRYSLASDLAAIGPEVLEGRGDGDAPSASMDLVELADFRLLATWFQGREGIHAIEAVNAARHRSFLPVQRPIRDDDWEAHLRGEKTLALPLVRSGNTAVIGVFDIDVDRRALDERLGVPDDLLGRALATALRLCKELERRGASSLLELSGYKGYHVWVRLEDPVPCFRLRRWLLDLIQAIGPLPEGVRIEEFPNRDRVKPESFRPVIKLPLGIHSRTGKRCVLLDDRGEVLADPFEAIRSLPRIPAQLVNEATSLANEPEADATREKTAGRIGPRARQMLERCHVLGYLARRAEETFYLNHRERSTLLCTLGHLGEEGAMALHAIISHTYNYRREVTTRHVERMPSWPMSCPKIREYHPEAAAVGTCGCQFELRGKAYPTPVLHALKISEVEIFRGRRPAGRSPQARRQGTSKQQAGNGPSSVGRGPKEPKIHPQAEEKIRKIVDLKRHRRGIDASISRLHRELSQLFDEARTETLQLAMGTLKRVKRADGEGWDFVIEV